MEIFNLLKQLQWESIYADSMLVIGGTDGTVVRGLAHSRKVSGSIPAHATGLFRWNLQQIP